MPALRGSGSSLRHLYFYHMGGVVPEDVNHLDHDGDFPGVLVDVAISIQDLGPALAGPAGHLAVHEGVIRFGHTIPYL